MAESSIERFRRLQEATRRVEAEKKAGKTPEELLGLSAADVPELPDDEAENPSESASTSAHVDTGISDEEKAAIEEIKAAGEEPIMDHSAYTSPLAAGVKGTTATLHVHRTWKDGPTTVKEEEDEEVIQIHPFVTDTALVTYGLKIVTNMGNYESVHVDVTVSLPSYVEEIADCYSAAKKFVNMQVNKEVLAIKNHRDKKRA